MKHGHAADVLRPTLEAYRTRKRVQLRYDAVSVASACHWTRLDTRSARLDAVHQVVDMRDDAQVNNRAHSSSDKDSPDTKSQAANCLDIFFFFQ